MAAVEDAVLVAGGIGSRMLPASAVIAKELLPLVDIPAISHLAREAVEAGAKRIHLITSPSKDFSNIAGDNSWASEKRADIAKEILSPFCDVDVFVHVQHIARGFGDALSCALHSINGPFMVLLGDNILLDTFSGTKNYTASNASKRLVEEYEKTLLPCVGLSAVDDPENYVFDELALVGDNDELLTHLIFHPIQKSLNRKLEIRYTLRITAGS